LEAKEVKSTATTEEEDFKPTTRVHTSEQPPNQGGSGDETTTENSVSTANFQKINPASSPKESMSTVLGSKTFK
jgi:hypothetical protein